MVLPASQPLLRNQVSRTLYALTLASILLGGWWVYRYQSAKIEDLQRRALQSISDLKSDEVRNWLRDRLALAEVMSHSDALRQAVRRAYATGAGDPHAYPLDELSRTLGLGAMLAADAVREQRHLAGASDPLRGPLPAGTDGQRAVLLGVSFAPDGRIWIDFGSRLASIAGLANPVWVIARYDAEASLLANLRRWPVPSESGETLLLMRDGEDVLYLGPRHGTAGPGQPMRRNLSDTQLVGARALHGEGPTLLGRDYRDREVIAEARPVGGIGWVTVTKLDLAEFNLLTDAWRYALLGFTAVVLCLATLTLRYVLRTHDLNARLLTEQAIAVERTERDRLARMTLAITNATQDAIFAKDRDGRYLLFNPAAERMIGRPAAEVIGSDDAKVFPAEVANALRTEDAATIARGTTRVFEQTLRLADGNWLTELVSKGPIRDGTGEIVGVFGIAHDITERKRLEEALALSDAAHRQLFYAAPVPMWIHDLETLRFLAVNDRAVEVYGWSREEFLAMTTADIHPAENLPALREGLDRTQAEPGWTPLRRHRTKAGALQEVEIISHTLDWGGRRAEVVLAHDVTTQRRAMRELAEAEARYRAVVEQNLIGIVIVRDGRIVYANPRMTALLGAPAPAALLGSAVTTIMPEAFWGPTHRAIEALLHGEVSEVQFEHSLIRLDGGEVEIGGHAVRIDFGGAPAVLSVLQEIGAKKQAEAAARQHLAHIERVLDSVVQVASVMVELRDPYTAGHERRVADLAAAIATELGWPPSRIAGLRIAGSLHDAGKIGVPAELLVKPTRLTPTEFDLIKQHAEKSYEILKGVDFPWPVAEAAWQHHERMDGSGYPRGLKGDRIIPEARILAVADTVEAMASHRPYRPGLGVERALEEIERQHGRHFDADAVDACLRLFRQRGYCLPE